MLNHFTYLCIRAHFFSAASDVVVHFNFVSIWQVVLGPCHIIQSPWNSVRLLFICLTLLKYARIRMLRTHLGHPTDSPPSHHPTNTHLPMLAACEIHRIHKMDLWRALSIRFGSVWRGAKIQEMPKTNSSVYIKALQILCKHSKCFSQHFHLANTKRLPVMEKSNGASCKPYRFTIHETLLWTIEYRLGQKRSFIFWFILRMHRQQTYEYNITQLDYTFKEWLRKGKFTYWIVRVLINAGFCTLNTIVWVFRWKWPDFMMIFILMPKLNIHGYDALIYTNVDVKIQEHWNVSTRRAMTFITFLQSKNPSGQLSISGPLVSPNKNDTN